jgi:tetratricopeptide (TPR) repeat protein
MLSMLKAHSLLRLPTGLDWIIPLALIGVIALFPFTSGWAQEGNRDYYAPGTGQSAHDIFKNVELYHLGAGYEELAHKRYDAALAHAEFMLRYFPNHPKALSLLSELCMRWQSPQCNTQEWFERAVARNPSAPVTYTLQGIALHRMKRYPQAVESYKKALELDPASLNSHYNLGLTYLELKQYELANEHAQKAYALGAPFPGLRDKLKKAGFWKPVSG